MEKLTAVLQQYAIYPQAIINVTNRLYKVKADGKQYALKRSRLKEKKLEMWQSVYHTAGKKGLHEVLPVYLTADKKLYVENAGEIYYLSPWIEGEISHFDKKALEHFYRMLGRLHLQTKQINKLDTDSIEENFTSYKDICAGEEKKLLTIIEAIERKHFPSPIELQILTQYRDLSQALKQSQFLSDQIIFHTKDSAEWTTSLVHGNLRERHIFKQNFINWEKAAFKHAFHDLSDFFTNESAKGQRQAERFIEYFPVYLEENPFTEFELSMLKLYLLSTTEYLTLLDENRNPRRQGISMVEKTIELEKNYRRIQFGLHFNKTVAPLESRQTTEGD
ncbi:phosphotransferase [Ralstonia pickettii]|nr:phosphotransferase [Ralstonia pickettii]